jgi:zinc transport system substrate-binding protein
MTKMRSTLLACLLTAAALAACSAPAPEDAGAESSAQTAPRSAKLSVYAVNYPLTYFAERISGDLVEVTLPVPAGVDPAYWEPDAASVIAFQEADLILLNGADYARWTQRATLPGAKLVDTSAGFRERWLPLEGSTVHSHGPEGEHSHAGWASTTWLDPTLAAEQARAVGEALVGALPDEELRFRQGLSELEADLAALDGRLGAAAEALDAVPILFSHPVYQYLIARYALEARSLHWEPDVAPEPGDWEELGELRAAHPAEWMIWEASPLAETASNLAELGVRSVVFTPGAGAPEAGDYLSLMSANAGALEALAGDSRP